MELKHFHGKRQPGGVTDSSNFGIYGTWHRFYHKHHNLHYQYCAASKIKSRLPPRF